MRNQNAAKKARRCDTCCGNTAPKMRCPSPHARDLPRDREILQSSSRTRTDADLMICEVSLSSFCLPDHSREMTIQGKRHSRIFLLPPSSGRRCPEGAEARSCYQLKKNVRYAFPRIVIPSAAEGSFSFPVSLSLRNAVCMKHRDPTSHGVRCFPLSAVLASFPDRERKRFLAFARNDDTGKRHSRISLLSLEGGAPKGRRLAHAIG